MNSKVKSLIGWIVFIGALVIVYFAYNALSGANRADEIISNINTNSKIASGEFAAPDFTVFDAQGNEVSLSEFIGRPIVINFWASWCPPCKSEMPHFNTVYGIEKDNVVFLMIDLVDGQRETKAKGQKYVTDQGFTFPIYFDTKNSAALAYGISSIPTTIFIDKEGNIVTAYQGAISEAKLNSAIDLIK